LRSQRQISRHQLTKRRSQYTHKLSQQITEAHAPQGVAIAKDSILKDVHGTDVANVDS
jgi:hypothetical protein